MAREDPRGDQLRGSQDAHRPLQGPDQGTVPGGTLPGNTNAWPVGRRRRRVMARDRGGERHVGGPCSWDLPAGRGGLSNPGGQAWSLGVSIKCP